jgi:hypothetical protein
MTHRQVQPDTPPEPATLDDHDELVEAIEDAMESLDDDGDDDIMAVVYLDEWAESDPHFALWLAYDVQPAYMREDWVGT